MPLPFDPTLWLDPFLEFSLANMTLRWEANWSSRQNIPGETLNVLVNGLQMSSPIDLSTSLVSK